MSRPVGSREIDIETIYDIVKYSDDGLSRAKIAKKTGVSKRTVYLYQRGFGFV